MFYNLVLAHYELIAAFRVPVVVVVVIVAQISLSSTHCSSNMRICPAYVYHGRLRAKYGNGLISERSR